jgi:hypothetical protein
MMNWTKAIAPFALGLGMIGSGPVLTMIMFPEKSEVSYVYGVIDGLSVIFAMVLWYGAWRIISTNPGEGG